MATGSLDSNGIWLYGEDDSEPTHSALLNKLGTSVSDTVTRLEQFTGYTGTLPIANGGTGAKTVAAAQDTLRVGLVPISPSSVTFVTGTGSTNTLGKISFNSCTKVEINDVFTSAYTNYRILIRQSSSAVNQPWPIRMRRAGADISTNIYYWMGAYQVYGGGLLAWSGLSTAADLGRTSNNQATSAVVDIFHPQLVDRTTMHVHTSSDSTSLMYSNASYNIGEFATHTGFSLFVNTGTITGTVQVFGYNE